MAVRRASRKATKLNRLPTVPYARGFKPPSATASVRAVGPLPSSSSLPAEYRPADDSFQPLAALSSEDDWLAQYNEPGQTYRQFVEDCPWLSKRKWKQLKQSFNPHGATLTEKYPQGSIYLLPLGEFDTHQPRFSALVEYVSIFYGLPVKVMNSLQLQISKGASNVQLVYDPQLAAAPTSGGGRASLRQRIHTLDCRYHSSTGHLQLQVNSILIALKQYVPHDAFFVMALTMLDLYDEPPDLFVAGMAAGNHRVGVFSFLRYTLSSFSKEHWYDYQLPATEDQRVVLQHSCKLVVHEVAHLLGVDHCIFYKCCMNGSGHIAEDYSQPMFLCPVDLHKLQTLCGFHVVQRYEKMAAFLKTHGLTDEEKWLRKRITYIKNCS